MRREENRVNDVDHTIGSFHIGDDDLYRIVQIYTAILDGDGDVLAQNRGALVRLTTSDAITLPDTT